MTKQKFSQFEIDQMIYQMVLGEPYEYPEDCERIRALVLKDRNVWVSVTAAGLFWSRHSQDWDASWLTLPKNDEHIMEYWDKFVEDWYRDDAEST